MSEYCKYPYGCYSSSPGERPCTASFAIPKYLRRHTERENHKKLYGSHVRCRCMICKTVFDSLDALQRHLASVHSHGRGPSTTTSSSTDTQVLPSKKEEEEFVEQTWCSTSSPGLPSSSSLNNETSMISIVAEVETTEVPVAETTEVPVAETTEAPVAETTEAPAAETEKIEPPVGEMDYKQALVIEKSEALSMEMKENEAVAAMVEMNKAIEDPILPELLDGVSQQKKVLLKEYAERLRRTDIANTSTILKRQEDEIADEISKLHQDYVLKFEEHDGRISGLRNEYDAIKAKRYKMDEEHLQLRKSIRDRETLIINLKNEIHAMRQKLKTKEDLLEKERNESMILYETRLKIEYNARNEKLAELKERIEAKKMEIKKKNQHIIDGIKEYSKQLLLDYIRDPI